ncbi:MAG: hypothetical protein JXM79_24745, partial [Sedimentisphaerales bacterium]|nr:hypothetical protein [Sedimentisphaerales bacterium]
MSKKVTCLISLILMLTPTTIVFADLISDPFIVVYYSFDEVGDIISDQSGNGHDGVVKGDITADPDGKRNGAAKFEGKGGPSGFSYIDLDGENFPTDENPTSAITISAWAKCENTGDHQTLFNARAADSTWVIHPELRSSGEFRWLLRAAGGTTIFDIRAGIVTWDEWLHFAGTYDKNAGKAVLHINGEVVHEE